MKFLGLGAYDKPVLFLVVVDAFKVGMPLNSFVEDFEVIAQNVEVKGCSIWVKPYDPTPLTVFDINSSNSASGDILRAPSVPRLMDFVGLESILYPNRQKMYAANLREMNLFYSQREIPDVTTGYAKIEDGNFSRKIYEGLWSDAIADSVWRK